jgi:uncharacterized protein YbjT (DUF2867 family)
MRCAFVTGGSGFVGRNLIAALRNLDVPEIPAEDQPESIEVRALARSEAAAARREGCGCRARAGQSRGWRPVCRHEGM